jgi:arylsulfatase A-like enzyme
MPQSHGGETMARYIPFLLVLLSGIVQAADKPNIVYVLCDDLGYGDLRCFNPEGKIATPHFDVLARSGMRFTDAHSGSAVCSPTRYGIMTGRYAWRSKLQSGVLGALSPRLIEPDRLTAPALLKQHGYHTACIGKWHLGMDWIKQPGKNVTELGIESAEQVWNVDFAQPYTNGPTAVGFDYYFGISGSLDMVPYTFLRDDRPTIVPTVDKHFPLMLGRKPMTRRGPAAEDFDATDVLPTLTRKAVEYIAARSAEAKAGRPFFLYLPFASPHTPIMPTKAWQGKSGLNPYADFVMQNDACLGDVLQALDDAGLAENTLVIVTSDNGCSPQADFPELKKLGHNPSYVFRGTKADIFEGGHRVPFIVRWPGKVKAGSSCDQTICHVDLLATCADLLGVQLPGDAGEDSSSILPTLRAGERKLPHSDATPLREAMVHHSVNGFFAIRQGEWKLCLCSHSGGWSEPRPNQKENANLPPVQLYNLEADIGETMNLAEKEPAVVDRLFALLQKYVADGRSTPGTPQKNAVAIDLWKNGAVKPPLPR